MKIRALLLIFLTIFIYFSCTKTVFVIEEPEQPGENSAPGPFDITVVKITDQDVEIKWGIASDPDKDTVTYEILLNDSVIIYNLVQNQYQIKSLKPDNEYRISVIAMDKLRNSSKSEITVRTRLSFLKAIFELDFDYHDYSFINAKNSADSGIIIFGKGGNAHSYRPYKYFLLKLNADFSISWKREFDLNNDDGYPVDFFEFPELGYFIIQPNGITKIDHQGNIFPFYKAPAGYNFFGLKAIERAENGNFMIIGHASSGMHNPDGKPSMAYFLIKTSFDGTEIWHKSGGNLTDYYPAKIYKINDNKYVITGIALKTEFNFWILTIDATGNELSEQIVPNKYEIGDLFSDCIVENDGSIVMAGAASGMFRFMNSSYYNTTGRIAKIDPFVTKSLIWDAYPDMLTSSGAFNSINRISKIQDTGGYMILSSDDRGAALCEVSKSGEVIRVFKLSGYPSGIFVRDNKVRNFYEYISSNGMIFFFNKDGYFQE